MEDKAQKTSLTDSALILSQISSAPSSPAASITWKNAVFQILASCVATSVTIQVGMSMSFSAILLPQLHDIKSTIPITKSQASWIASLMAIALPFGALIIGPLVDKYGRKKMCLVSLLPFCISWLVTINAKKVWHFYLARILAGFGGGLTTAALIYVSEITHPSYRTMLLSFNSVFVSFGILLTCCLGLWCSWRSMALINSLLALASFASLCFLPESPHWFVVFANNSAKAAKSLKWLYREQSVFESQCERVIESVPERNSTEDAISKNFTEKAMDELNLYRKRSVYRPFMILVAIFVFQQLSCAYVIIFYAVDLFRDIGGHFGQGIDEYVALVLLGSLRFVIAVISSVMSKRVGRRTLLLGSGVGMCFTSLLAGVYMYLNVIPPDELAILHLEKDQSDDNIVLYCVLGYVCFSSFGYLVIPWTLTGELLPVKVRGKLSGLLIALAYVSLFATVKLYPTVVDWLKLQSLFYCLALVNVFGVIFVFFCLPETLGKTFQEIEVYFK